MYGFPIEYEGRVYRPPSEGESLLIQVTIGCSNNKCTYCAMYRDKTYRERSWKEIEEDIEKGKRFLDSIGQYPSKVFLCDGDALGASTELLCKTLDKLNKCFPDIRRVGVYATAQNILEKSCEDLKVLHERNLSIAYLGMESGDDQVLKLVVKGNDSSDMIKASQKIRRAGFKLSVIAMLGLGGKKFSKDHCENTAKAISLMKPEFFSFLTTTPVPGTPYAKMVSRDTWQELSNKELLTEMRDIIANINLSNDRIILRANHVSNLHPLAGVLPQDKENIIENLNSWIDECPENTYVKVDPSNL